MKEQEIKELQQKPWSEVYCIEGYTMTKEQSDAMYDEVYKPVVEWEKDIAKSNKEIMKQVRSIVSGSLYYGICAYIKELKENSYHIGQMQYKIVEKPKGDKQKESWSKDLQYVWVDQHSDGCEGDSYYGDVYIKVEEDKYLTVNYSM